MLMMMMMTTSNSADDWKVDSEKLHRTIENIANIMSQFYSLNYP